MALTQAATKPEPKIGANKRTKHQREADLAFIEHHYLRGVTCRRMVDVIAANRPYRLSFQTIANDLKKLDVLWRQQALASRDAYKRRELENIAAQEAEAWVRYHEAVTTAAVEEMVEKESDQGKGRRKTRRDHGDPARWMEVIIKLRDQRIKLLGLDEPTKLELTGEDGGPIKHQVDEALEKIYGDPRYAIPVPPPDAVPPSGHSHAE